MKEKTKEKTNVWNKKRRKKEKKKKKEKNKKEREEEKRKKERRKKVFFRCNIIGVCNGTPHMQFDRLVPILSVVYFKLKAINLSDPSLSPWTTCQGRLIPVANDIKLFSSSPSLMQWTKKLERSSLASISTLIWLVQVRQRAIVKVCCFCLALKYWTRLKILAGIISKFCQW
jgi:hypothetical protein